MRSTAARPAPVPGGWRGADLAAEPRQWQLTSKELHNIVLAERPDLLRVLYDHFPNDQRGEEQPGEPGWCPLPVFSQVDGDFAARYLRPSTPQVDRTLAEATERLHQRLGVRLDGVATLRRRLHQGDGLAFTVAFALLAAAEWLAWRDEPLVGAGVGPDGDT